LNLIEVILAQGSSLKQAHGFSVGAFSKLPTCHRLKATRWHRPFFHSTGLHRLRPRPAPVLAAACWRPAGAWPCAQDSVVSSITITGRSSGNSAGIAGFGDVPLYRSPFSATVITTGQLGDAGITGLGDLTRLDAGTTDAYNAPGYWGLMAVRGFTLDPQFNYRRDGLPINAETMLPLANKRGLELLKGTSGLQAGTSSPGGLVNLSVKRPRGACARPASAGRRTTRAAWRRPGRR
jgi:outer membrane receptor protein involved in Fe transport